MRDVEQEKKYNLDVKNHSFEKFNKTQTYKITLIDGLPKRIDLRCPSGSGKGHEKRNLTFNIQHHDKIRSIYTHCECGLTLAKSDYDMRARPRPVVDEFFYEELDKDFNWIFKNRGEHE